MIFSESINVAKPILEIDLKSIEFNYFKLCELSSPSEVCAVLKANAYGCGIEKISTKLEEIGCKKFFVAKLEEGIELRSFISEDCKIFIFDGLLSNDIYIWEKYKLIPVCNTIEQLNLSIKFNISYSIHIDTGMNRLGIKLNEIPKDFEKKDEKYFQKLELIISHFSCSDDKNSPNNNKQIKRFNSINHLFKNVPRSLANSHGIIHFKNAMFDFTRPGLALYGYLEHKQNILKPAVKLFAPILQIKNININEEIGYGGSFKVKRKTLICVLGIGYADGFKRIIGNRTKLVYKNFEVPIVGRISMDTTILDITDIPKHYFENLKVFPILDENFGVNELANECNTIPYEILTSFGNRIKRIYKN